MVATRTLKNSSLLLEKMPRKRSRSMSGTFGSSASCSTRALKESQLRSRLIKGTFFLLIALRNCRYSYSRHEILWGGWIRSKIQYSTRKSILLLLAACGFFRFNGSFLFFLSRFSDRLLFRRDYFHSFAEFFCQGPAGIFQRFFGFGQCLFIMTGQYFFYGCLKVRFYLFF